MQPAIAQSCLLKRLCAGGLRGLVGGQVMREFRLPEGMSPADLDAASDSQSGMLVVLDLRGDDSLQAAGLAREVCHKQIGRRQSGWHQGLHGTAGWMMVRSCS